LTTAFYGGVQAFLATMAMSGECLEKRGTGDIGIEVHHLTSAELKFRLDGILVEKLQPVVYVPGSRFLDDSVLI